ncbi:8202_t:CDS:2 [Entrophospora sp. SA101]|nr:8202_t:CDS:2 [Entrophospora sp. SA101]
MSAIATKIIEKYNLSPKMGLSGLSPHTSEFLKNLTDDRKWSQARRRLRDGFKFTNEQIINAFPVRGYHTEKKPYIHITTWNQYDRYNALKAVCESGMETASDDLNLSVDEYKPIDENEYKNPLIAPALFRDKTLVLTWDIETHNGELNYTGSY